MRPEEAPKHSGNVDPPKTQAGDSASKVVNEDGKGLPQKRTAPDDAGEKAGAAKAKAKAKADPKAKAQEKASSRKIKLDLPLPYPNGFGQVFACGEFRIVAKREDPRRAGCAAQSASFL